MFVFIYFASCISVSALCLHICRNIQKTNDEKGLWCTKQEDFFLKLLVSIQRITILIVSLSSYKRFNTKLQHLWIHKHWNWPKVKSLVFAKHLWREKRLVPLTLKWDRLFPFNFLSLRSHLGQFTLPVTALKGKGLSNRYKL